MPKLGLGLLLRAVRAPSLTAGAMPAVLAAALARHDGFAIDGLHFGLLFAGLVALQSGVNLINDYYDDASGLDADPDFADVEFPLGSRVIQRGELTRRGVLALALAFFAVGAACGLYLNTLNPGNWVLWLGLLGAGLGYSYTAPPLSIAYRGAGEPITFALFGPVSGLGAYYVLTGTITLPALLLSCVAGALSMAILFLHHFPQREADAKHGKRTPVVRLGPERAGRLVPVILATPYLLVVTGVVVAWLPLGALAFCLTMPLATTAIRAALSHPASPGAMTRAALLVLAAHFLGSLLLAGGIALS